MYVYVYVCVCIHVCVRRRLLKPGTEWNGSGTFRPVPPTKIRNARWSYRTRKFKRESFEALKLTR